MLAGGLPSASFVFRHLKLGRPEAHESQYNRCRTHDRPLQHRHVFHAVANAMKDLGDEVRNKLHDLVFGSDPCVLKKVERCEYANTRFEMLGFLNWPSKLGGIRFM